MNITDIEKSLREAIAIIKESGFTICTGHFVKKGRVKGNRSCCPLTALALITNNQTSLTEAFDNVTNYDSLVKHLCHDMGLSNTFIDGFISGFDSSFDIVLPCYICPEFSNAFLLGRKMRKEYQLGIL